MYGVVRPTMLYGFKFWAADKKIEQWISVEEMTKIILFAVLTKMSWKSTTTLQHKIILVHLSILIVNEQSLSDIIGMLTVR